MINWCQSKFLICEVADVTPSAQAQSEILGHAFRMRWLFTEISNMLRTDDNSLSKCFYRVDQVKRCQMVRVKKNHWRLKLSQIFQ